VESSLLLDLDETQPWSGACRLKWGGSRVLPTATVQSCRRIPMNEGIQSLSTHYLMQGKKFTQSPLISYRNTEHCNVERRNLSTQLQTWKIS
jgi:hypothetical protein